MAAITGSVGRGGTNGRRDVETVQRLLNQHIGRLTPLSPLVVDGLAGGSTVAAIETFQRRVLHMSRPDGRVDPGGRTFRALNGDMVSGPVIADAPWLDIARDELGVRESVGVGRNNARILQYLATFPYLQAIWRDDHAARLGDVDETPWCACFVNWCLIRAGKTAGPSARARDWLRYGTALEAPKPGAIAVVYHRPGASTAGTTSSGYHVAFHVESDADSITLLGGNQGDQVSEKTFHRYWTVKGFRWPA